MCIITSGSIKSLNFDHIEDFFFLNNALQRWRDPDLSLEQHFSSGSLWSLVLQSKSS